MKLALLPLLLLSFGIVGCVNVDKLIAALGSRSASLSRTRVGIVFDKYALLLNVSAQTHSDQCAGQFHLFIKFKSTLKPFSDFIEQLSSKEYPSEDVIHTITNFTSIEEVDIGGRNLGYYKTNNLDIRFRHAQSRSRA